MPQALDEQRELMHKWFGDPIDDSGPYLFLIRHGYKDRAGMWIKPTPAHEVSDAEWQCIAFLCDEWDAWNPFHDVPSGFVTVQG